MTKLAASPSDVTVVGFRVPVRSFSTAVAGNEEPRKFHMTTYIHRPPAEVYEAWVAFQDLPCFMRAAGQSHNADDTTSDWALVLLGATVPWKAVTTEKAAGQRIAWQSTGTPACRNGGCVTFQRSGYMSTKVTVVVEFEAQGTPWVTGETLKALRQRLERELEDLSFASLSFSMAMSPALL